MDLESNYRRSQNHPDNPEEFFDFRQKYHPPIRRISRLLLCRCALPHLKINILLILYISEEVSNEQKMQNALTSRVVQFSS